MSLYDAVKNAANPYTALTDALTEMARAKRFPSSAMFELSPVCNFKCPFCYARISPEDLAARGEQILRFPTWKAFIDGAAEMGTSHLTLSGGECMMHPDFLQIYRYAYERGLTITLMTNGSCVTPEILATLAEYPPEFIYLTLYGRSPEAYEKVCGSAAFYERVVQNIRSLKAHNLQVVLQFTADRDNLDDLKAVYDLAKELDVPLRHTLPDLVFRHATPEILEEYAAKESAYRAISEQIFYDQHGVTEDGFRSGAPKIVNPIPQKIIEKGIPCGAGRTSFAVNYRGEMLPCITFDAIKISAIGKNLQACWLELVRLCDEVPRLTECTNCIFKTRCKTCTALHYNDTHEFGKPSPRICLKHRFPERTAALQAKFDRDGYLLREDLEDL